MANLTQGPNTPSPHPPDPSTPATPGHSGLHLPSNVHFHLPQHVQLGPWLVLGIAAGLLVLWLKWYWRPGASAARSTRRAIGKAVSKGIRKETRRSTGAGGGSREEWDFGVVALPWRYVSGKPLDGRWRTDAGWLHRGNLASGDGASSSRWHMLSRLERAGIRLFCLVIVYLTIRGFVTNAKGSLETVKVWSLISLTGLGMWAGWRAVDRIMIYRHMRDWVLPTHNVLRPIIGYPADTRPEQYLFIPSNWSEVTGDAIRVELPATYHNLDPRGEQIRSVLTSKLGLQDVSFSFKLAGADHHLVVKQLPRPRSMVAFSDADLVARVKRAAESAPLMGLTHRDAGVSVDLDAESPHILVSASTGGGKSVITRTISCQILHNGGIGDILDVKRHSHKWARGLPNVRYSRDIADIHYRLIELGEEAAARNLIVDDWEGDDADAPVGPRRLILIEEANALIRKLKAYWARIREKEDPKESPAIDALAEILFMGRAVKFHVILVAQSATAAALGGPEMRECFATRILARYTVNAWKMLVPEVSPIPKSTRHTGRAQVVLGGEAKETQILFFTPAEARAWAISGTVTPFEDFDGPGSGVPVSQDGLNGSHPGQTISGVSDTPGLRLVPNQPQPTPAPAGISLRDAVNDGVLTITLDAARKASVRDQEFPPAVDKRGPAKLYDPSALRRWERNRPGTKNDDSGKEVV
jgi:hypothetical protein